MSGKTNTLRSTEAPKKHSFSRRELAHEIEFRRHIERHSSYFASLNLKHRAALTGYLQASIFRRHVHRDNPDLQTLHHDQLWKTFRGKFHAINANLKWFEVEIQHRYGDGTARGWRLMPEAIAMIESYLTAAHTSIAPGYEDADGIPIRNPRAAIETLKSSGGKTRFRGAEIRAAVGIDGDSLHGFDAACAAWLAGDQCPAGYEYAFKEWRSVAGDTGPNGGIDKAHARVKKARWQAAAMEMFAKCSNLPGLVMPQVYQEANSGRLYAVGSVTLQGCRREVKRAALRGCWEYDFANAHWCFLRQLAPKLDLPAVDAYLADKRGYRQRIASEAGISEADAKTCIIALIYGASLSVDPAKAIPKEIGIEAAGRLRKSELMNALWVDVKDARKQILEKYAKRTRAKHRRAGLVNDAGNLFDPTGIPRGKLTAAKLAHILQGAESEALHACMDVAGPSLTLLQHDGFTSQERLSVSDLCDAIKQRTGFDLELSEEQL